MLTVEPHCYGN